MINNDDYFVLCQLSDTSARRLEGNGQSKLSFLYITEEHSFSDKQREQISNALGPFVRWAKNEGRGFFAISDEAYRYKDSRLEKGFSSDVIHRIDVVLSDYIENDYPPLAPSIYSS